jgi:predicted class III extradiol MEMO1 family dioxygenase
MDEFAVRLKKLIDGLTKVILDSLIAEDIDQDEAAEISRFILERKKTITNDSELNNFLTELKDRYFIFSSFLDSFEKESQIQKEDAQKIEAIKSQLLKFSQ